MGTGQIDLDLLARHLRSKMDDEGSSARAAAEQIGCSPATLSRLLKGSASDLQPDTSTLIRAASWVGKSLADFEVGAVPVETTLADVEVHLRALPGLGSTDREALVAMVRAAYDAASQLRTPEGPRGKGTSSPK